MPKADEAIQNALLYQVWNWSLRVRVRQTCKANREAWAANALSTLQLSTVLLPNAIYSIPFS